LSPGNKRPRATLSSLAEDLASHGYVVAVIDHTYENVATTFPDGRVTDCVACGDYNQDHWDKLEAGRAKDVSFVLDELTKPGTRWGNLVDSSRIAMGGHSVGGASATVAILADSRIRAGFDIDGITNTPLPSSGLDRPFMFLGRANTYTPGSGPAAESWERDWPLLTGWKRWFLVAGMEHASFTDIGIIAEQLGLDIGADTPAERGAAITRTYVNAFLDLHLLGRSQPLMEQPSTRYPEVSLTRTSTPYMPTPTGDQPVGSTSLYLKDTSRRDPWVPSVGYRELMVSVFYPTASTRGARAQYMTAAESVALLEDSGLDVAPDVLSRTRTNSVVDARPAGRGLPLVVLSPGYTKPRATLTALAEDLASHGYVVAVVGHTYENAGTSFPDGRFVGCASCEVPHNPAFWEKLVLGRAADVSFVLDQLTRGRWAGVVDPARIGMAGHSVGGASTIPTMVGDDRVLAGMNIDGTTMYDIPDPGLDRPFMFMSHQLAPTACTADNPSWERDWARMTGWKRWAEVAGTQHASFTDVGLFAEQIGVDIGATTTATRTQAITRAYVNAFFDQHLRGTTEPALDYPEVTFCH
jgi:predicted dienelactone hydrolase